MFRETCSCGASIEFTDSWPRAMTDLKAWREKHQHNLPAAGQEHDPQLEQSPALFSCMTVRGNGPYEWCYLPRGHDSECEFVPDTFVARMTTPHGSAPGGNPA